MWLEGPAPEHCPHQPRGWRLRQDLRLGRVGKSQRAQFRGNIKPNLKRHHHIPTLRPVTCSRAWGQSFNPEWPSESRRSLVLSRVPWDDFLRSEIETHVGMEHPARLPGGWRATITGSNQTRCCSLETNKTSVCTQPGAQVPQSWQQNGGDLKQRASGMEFLQSNKRRLAS